MEVQDVIAHARETLTVKRVFGEPYEKNGVTVIPVARVQGGAGGGGSEGPPGQGKGSGSGFGMRLVNGVALTLILTVKLALLVTLPQAPLTTTL